MILVDTTIWSLALRRRSADLNPVEARLVTEWAMLGNDGSAAIIGPIRQEILSGIRHAKDFAAIQTRLTAFEHVDIVADDYDRAAEYFNTLRSKGVVGGGVDLLICAVADRIDVAVFTTDPDFTHYARHIPVRLHVVA